MIRCIKQNSKQVSARNISRNNLSFSKYCISNSAVPNTRSRLCSLCSNAKLLSVSILGHVTTNWIHAEPSGLENGLWDSRCPLLTVPHTVSAQQYWYWYRTENVYVYTPLHGTRATPCSACSDEAHLAGVVRLRFVDVERCRWRPCTSYFHLVASVAGLLLLLPAGRHQRHWLPTRRRTLHLHLHLFVREKTRHTLQQNIWR